MLMMPDPTTARIDPYTAIPTMYLICDIYDPITRARYRATPRGVAQRAEAYLRSLRHRRIPPTSARSRSSSSSTRPVRAQHRTRLLPRGRLGRGLLEHRADEDRTSATRSGRRAATYPVPPHDTLMDLRSEMVLTMEELGIPVEIPPPRGRHRRSVRDRHALRLADHDGRQGPDLQVRGPQHRAGARQGRAPSCRSRSSPTTAPACTSTSRSGRAART